MATIRPASFPSAAQPGQESTAVRRARPDDRQAPKQARPGGQRRLRVQPAQRVKPGVGVRSASDLEKSSRERKLKQAIHVLRAKSVELYQPDGSRTQAAPRLGQIVDIKA